MSKIVTLIIKGQIVVIDVTAIACLTAGVCQNYPECDGEVKIEAGDVICTKCGKYQDCGDVRIRKTCRVLS